MRSTDMRSTSSCSSSTWDLGQDEQDDSARPSLVLDGLRVLQQLLDPAEAHAELLRNAAWFEGWWQGAKTSELGLGNIHDFLSYTLFCKRSKTTTRMLHQASLRFVAALGLDISSACGGDGIEGRNPRAKFIAHTEEPLRVCYRPLAFYLLTEAVAGWSHVALTRRQGFVLSGKTHIATYYIRHAPGGAASSWPPIVFLHGIGLGLAPYTPFLRRLVLRNPGRTIIAVQCKHVSMRLTSSIPTATEVADDLALLLQSQGISRVIVIGHSYGTLVASSLAKKHAALLSGLVLIDPVCFAMWLPHLVSNTIHFDAWKGQLQPKAAAGQEAALEPALRLPQPRRWQPVRSLMRGLVIRELHCATAMSRRFRWADLNLWTSEIPRNTTAVLGGKDNMIPAAQILQLLTSPAAAAKGVNVLFNPSYGHGSFLLHPELQNQILAAMDSCSLMAAEPNVASCSVMPSSPRGPRGSMSPAPSPFESSKVDKAGTTAGMLREPRRGRRKLKQQAAANPLASGAVWDSAVDARAADWPGTAMQPPSCSRGGAGRRRVVPSPLWRNPLLLLRVGRNPLLLLPRVRLPGWLVRRRQRVEQIQAPRTGIKL